MTFAAAALLGLTMGQPLGPDYYPMNSRTIKLPVEYKKDRKTIRHVFLYVARNGENVWTQEGSVTPDKDHFVYVAKEDGVYWFKMQIVDLKGNKDPAELTTDPADLKMVIDTAPPQIRVTNAKRTGDEIVVEWAVDDKFPNDAETKVQFRPAGNATAYWQDVTLPAASRTGVKFPCGTSDGITLKISTADVAGNRSEVTREFPAGDTRTALSPGPSIAPAPTPPVTNPGDTLKPTPPAGNTNPPAPTGLGPTGLGGAAPIAPPASSGVVPLDPGPPIKPFEQPAPLVNPAPLPNTAPLVNNNPPLTGGPQPLATVDPKAQPPVRPAHSGATPAGAWSGAPPAVEMTRAQAINYPRFDLGFDLETRGPSGISRVDLWVTRDDGRSWRKWSQHDGKGGAVRVALDAKENEQLEGGYGFRLVPVSGAGLSEREPVAGDAPDMRVTLDVTAPLIDLFPPLSDPNALDTLIIQWKATDRNFGDDPITLEWSDAPNGPWKPIATTGTDPVVQATAVNAPVAKRLANTGQYGWRVPAGVPARVYLKATARDAAGNVKEVVTREPILVDLTKPRAKISGIVTPGTVRP